jgi:hypothetical protein
MAVTKIKEAKELAESFNALTTDLERIEFIAHHSDMIGVALDNDHTQTRWLIDEDLEEEEQDIISEVQLNDFDDFCGDDDLTFTMWEALGIEAEGV